MVSLRESERNEPATTDLARLLLRLTIGGLILLHGMAKVIEGPDGVIEMLRAQGWPGMFGYFVYIGEVVAPVLLIVGWSTRIGALLVMANMTVAIAVAHRDEVLALSDTGGWAIELQALYWLGALAILLLGAGRLSLGGVRGRFN